MRLPAIQGIIDRRILVNYRVDPAIISQLLPLPFRPKLAGGFAMAGICLIRLKQLRPVFIPIAAGAGSENAAHRIAVEWERDGQHKEGVYIPRRDTNSRFNTLVGGRIFPGEHHHAKFSVRESFDRMQVAFLSDDGQVAVSVIARVSDHLPEGSVFKSLEEASKFFEGGATGYSATRNSSRLDGLELRCKKWAITSLEVESVRSSYFEDETRFPKGSVHFDCALLMRGIEHEWHSQPDLCCGESAAG